MQGLRSCSGLVVKFLCRATSAAIMMSEDTITLASGQEVGA